MRGKLQKVETQGCWGSAEHGESSLPQAKAKRDMPIVKWTNEMAINFPEQPVTASSAWGGGGGGGRAGDVFVVEKSRMRFRKIQR